MTQDPVAYAQKYVEDLLTFFGLNVQVDATRDEDVIELSVPSTHLNGFLIGHNGETLRAIQFLAMTALKNQELGLTRVNLDIADYKRQRNDRLAAQATKWIEEVRTSGQPMALKPMSAAERRVIHHTTADYSGVTSASEGEGRERHVVLKPETTEPDSADEAAAGDNEA
jgi:spoIIIJ-associated protein